MDLYAYCQIGELEKIAEANGIKVERVRGYRLMSECEPYTKEEIEEDREYCITRAVEHAIASEWHINPYCYVYGWPTDRQMDKYLGKDRDTVYWDKLHGKKRKIAKWYIKMDLKDFDKHYKNWNKYCGRKDVLYIHAKLGTWNWWDYDASIYEEEPWFLDWNDDCLDNAYCNIYAKIKGEET